ncbi:MAG: apolipoprotein N-acyltransferase [Rickettsiales bacterium]|nr:apolipoprotein N-acyltransferase [Rickettsiales bacterium]
MKALKRYSLATLCGVLATAALPPVHLFFLLIPAFSGFFYLLWYAQTKRQAFFTGWWFGLGYFTSGLYWFAHALLVEPDKFAWMIPFAVLGLPSILAIYYGLATLLTHWLRKRFSLRGILTIFLFALVWLGAEWLRGHLFSGFPWSLVSYAWAVSEPMMQWAYLIGSYHYAAWTVLLSTLPVVWFLTDNSRQRTVALSVSLLMVSIPFSYGTWRLNSHPTEYTDHQLHIVQGNIAQQHKWNPDKQYAAVQTYVELTKKDEVADNAIVIWPETAFPYFLEAATPPVKFIADSLPKHGVLLTGAMRAEWNKGRQGIKSFFNSVHAVRPDGSVETTYDKVRLVPFGEFVPLRGILPVEKITHGIQDFVHGEGAKSLHVKGVPAFQPLICYETIFPEFKSEGARWLLNVTNDAWFGQSAGPYQHLQMARFRAVEQGIPMVRAANTGISAVFDAYGRELASLPLGERGTITMMLPKPAL